MMASTDEVNAVSSAPTQLRVEDVKSLRVYPPVALARVGNAPHPEDFLLGPEVIGGAPTLPDGKPARTVEDFRDANGAIKRHAARFRVYAELNSGDTIEVCARLGASVTWSVALANLKAGWYDFNQAMDLGEPISQPALRRNRQLPKIPGGRGALDIIPTPISISGAGLSGDGYVFNDGTFCHKQVYLGELRTDAEGRLIVLGGYGKSDSFRPGLMPVTFANNFGWHDDVSDGPVRAQVTFAGGESMEAEAGWVAVTPPNFAPGLVPLVTMDDTVREVFYEAGWLERPSTTSFTNDVWPIFDRLTGLQWVNHGLFMIHGVGSPLDARDPAVIDRLRTGSTEWRQQVLALIHHPGSEAKSLPLIPQIFGDAYGETAAMPDKDPRVELSVTATQYAHLRRWAEGQFEDDWKGIPPLPEFDSLSPREQAVQLERAPLHECIGGPFHPGIELTWTMRLKSVWSGPYRLHVLPGTNAAKQDYGTQLTPETCLGKGGPYDGIAAGALTRFLGVPWQTDGTSCNSDADYAPWTFLSMPTFWGARVPDQVFAEANYERIRQLDPVISAFQIAKHFAYRADWLRDVRGRDYYDRLQNMIANWADLGMVLEAVDAPAGLLEGARVEQGRASRAGGDPKRHLVANIEALAHPGVQVPHVLRAALKSIEEVDQKTPARPARRPFRQDEV
jgi:hypothetical protein